MSLCFRCCVGTMNGVRLDGFGTPMWIRSRIRYGGYSIEHGAGRYCNEGRLLWIYVHAFYGFVSVIVPDSWLDLLFLYLEVTASSVFYLPLLDPFNRAAVK